MKIVRINVENMPGIPYSQSAKHNVPMKDRESHEDYDLRTWREHCTVNKDGQVCVPMMAWKQCLDTCAQKLGHKVPGKRGASFKGYFVSGVLCPADTPLFNGKALTKELAEPKTIYANLDGVRGSGKRGDRTYPEFSKWHCIVEFWIVDDIITQPVFEDHFNVAGRIVGIGRFRPERGGTNGRFRATNYDWQDMQV